MLDVAKLTDQVSDQIARFAATHPDERINAFALNGSLLCCNTADHFQASLTYYIDSASERFKAHYQSDTFRRNLFKNTGDWKFQGFATLTAEHGMDPELLEEYRDMDPEEQINSDFHQSLAQILDNLHQRQAFAPLSTTPEFVAFVVVPAENE